MKLTPIAFLLLLIIGLILVSNIKAYNLCNPGESSCDASKSPLFVCDSPYAHSNTCGYGIVSWRPYNGECGSLWCTNPQIPNINYQLDQCRCYFPVWW